MKPRSPDKTPVVLTPEEKRTLFSTAHAVWNNIGGDVLQCVADEQRKNINHVNIPADEVVEVVCDADRLHDELRRSKKLTPNLEAIFADYPQLEQLLRQECFTFTRYGM
jgi:hypothetical protein